MITRQERRIARKLSAIYLIYGVVAGGLTCSADKGLSRNYPSIPPSSRG